MQLSDIETRAARLAKTRAKLAEVVGDLDADIAKARRRRMPIIKKLVAEAEAERSAIQLLIEDNKHLFVRPRTVVMHGIKIGLAKGKGKIEIPDAAQVIKLIRKQLPEQADLLIKTTEEPVKGAIAGLTVAELKKIGVTVIEAGDQVVIKPTDGEVEKLVDALLKSAADTSETATAGEAAA